MSTFLLSCSICYCKWGLTPGVLELRSDPTPAPPALPGREWRTCWICEGFFPHCSCTSLCAQSCGWVGATTPQRCWNSAVTKGGAQSCHLLLLSVADHTGSARLAGAEGPASSCSPDTRAVTGAWQTHSSVFLCTVSWHPECCGSWSQRLGLSD